ncbi:signal peptidase I [Flexithrix dorotheae]|uniref:signal peptidase I n=1 Tax=Flexithrix dorotheae TaxID=70993 RepID=UPI00035EE5EC|nr:signal peptidase I [Flexithrix dorotheae]
MNKIAQKVPQGNNGKTEVKGKKSVVREWLDAIVFAVIAATIIRALFLEAFMIPTPSMERSLLVGDYLFVSKFHYGTRTPQTPLQIPLTFQKIWGTEIPAYLEWIDLPMFRLPGFSEIRRNDPVVFNVPHDLENPVDMRTYYIKRCVGIAGDTLKINNQQVYINGVPAETKPGMQSSYFLKTSQVINQKVFKRNKITDIYRAEGGYVVQTTAATAEKLKVLGFIEAIEPIIYEKGVAYGAAYFNESGFNHWNIDNFGPLYIPEAGASLEVNEQFIANYGHLVKHYEHHHEVEVKEDKLFIEGQEIKRYTFQQDYFFMMGDNRHNSLDSREWGFVPMDHIVGKALITWWSVDEQESFANILDKIRWNRIFRGIE